MTDTLVNLLLQIWQLKTLGISKLTKHLPAVQCSFLPILTWPAVSPHIYKFRKSFLQYSQQQKILKTSKSGVRSGDKNAMLSGAPATWHLKASLQSLRVLVIRILRLKILTNGESPSLAGDSSPGMVLHFIGNCHWYKISASFSGEKKTPHKYDSTLTPMTRRPSCVSLKGVSLTTRRWCCQSVRI